MHFTVGKFERMKGDVPNIALFYRILPFFHKYLAVSLEPQSYLFRYNVPILLSYSNKINAAGQPSGKRHDDFPAII
jgi:hypothetical protein